MKKLLLLFLAVFVAGCVRTEEHARGSDEGGFAAREAQEYFEQNAEEFNLPGLLSGQAQDGTRAEGLPEISLTPDWNEASSYKAYGVEVVDVPILSNVKQKIRRHDRQPDEAARLYEPGIESRLVIVAAGNHEGHNHADAEAEDEVRMFVVTMVPDWGAQFEKATETRFLHPENDFSGLVFFSELDGTLGETWEFREGKRTRQMHAHLKSDLTTEEYRAMTESVDLTAGISLPRTALTRNSEQSCKYCLPGNPCMEHTSYNLDEIVIDAPAKNICAWCESDPCVCNAWKCYYCGSRYCYGECLTWAFPPYDDGGGHYGGGGSDYGDDGKEDYTPPKERDDVPIESVWLGVELGWNAVSLGDSYRVVIQKSPVNATEKGVEVEYIITRSDGTYYRFDPISGINSLTYYARTPGQFTFRAEVKVPGRSAPIVSNTSVTMNHYFPTASEVLSHFKGSMDAMWNSTLNLATTTATYEQAAVMRIDTRGERASWIFDSYTSPAYPYRQTIFPAPFPSTESESLLTANPITGGHWTIGYFHTHPAWHYATYDRAVGPSADDHAPAENIPAWVMDYQSERNNDYITPSDAMLRRGVLTSYGGDGRK